MVKIQEPKLVKPVAVVPPDEILNVGELPPLVNCSVVAAVVPNSGTPAGKVYGVFTMAATTAGEAGAIRFAVATIVGAGGVLLPPSPHAANVMIATASTAARKDLEAFIMRKSLVDCYEMHSLQANSEFVVKIRVSSTAKNSRFNQLPANCQRLRAR